MIPFKNYRLPQHLDVVLLLVIGILLQVLDGSPFTLKDSWKIVWETDLPANHFGPFVQKCIKMILSIIVTVRCTTTYAYVVAAMLAIFCILKKTAPKLMLLWLLVAAVKSISMIFLEGLTGVYVCSAFGRIRKPCVEFFIVKALELIFSTYLWASVSNIYKDMEKKLKQNSDLEREQLALRNREFRRPRARSLIDESTLNKTTCLNNFERRDVPLIILQMLRRNGEMSEDSLLDPGMMLTSVSNLGSFDNIKTSQSLGELGFTDLSTTQVLGLEEDSNLSKPEMALKFLKLTRSEVRRIQLNKSYVGKDIYNVDDDIWKRVVASGTHINQPKQPRTEVFIRKISPVDLAEENINASESRKQLSLRSLFSLFQGDKEVALEEAQHEQDEDYFDPEDHEETETVDRIFMSNLKDGAPISRFRVGASFKKARGLEYARLYTQDFMSEIGPEVFDKATKLPKLTSLSKIRTVGMSAPSLQRKKSKKIKYLDEGHCKKGDDNTCTATGGVEDPSFMQVSDGQQLDSDHVCPYSEHTITFELEEPEYELEHPSDLKLGVEGREAETKNKEPSELKLEDEKPEELKAEDEEITNIRETKSEDKIPEQEEGTITKVPSYVHPPEPTRSDVDNSERTKPRSYYRTRRIKIRWIGQRKPKTLLHGQFSDNQGPSDNSDRFKDNSQISTPKREKDYPERPQSSKKQSSSKNSRIIKVKSIKSADLRQIYYVTQLIKKPLFDNLVTYNNLKKKVNLKSSFCHQREKSELSDYGKNNLKQTEKLLNTLAHESKKQGNWKSEVLKRSELRTQVFPASFGSALNSLKKRAAIKKLLKYECHYLMQKYKSLHKRKVRDLECISFSVTGSKKDTPHEGRNSPKAESQTTLNLTDSVDSTEFMSLRRKESHHVDETPSEVLSRRTTDSASFGEDDVRRSPTDTAKLEEKLDRGSTASDVLSSDPEGEFLSSQEADEPISLYYSKAANLASPLLDMKGFIYPDHIHYSYKHVKKKGFDVDINGGFPLLMRESLTVGQPVKMEQKWAENNCEITRRPMDLSFANTNAFAEWQNKDQNDVDQTVLRTTVAKEHESREVKFDSTEHKRTKDSRDYPSSRKPIKNEIKKPKPKTPNFNELKYLYQTKDSVLVEKLLKMHRKLNMGEDIRRRQNEERMTQRTPIQISSTQLHSNKGRLSSTYNPAKILQENRAGNEKKKSENQKERTKDMFARLEREALLQNKMFHQSFGTNRNV